MKSYKILGHTADIRLRVEASTLQELFEAAIEGMSHIMKPSIVSTEEKIKRTIETQSPDTTALLIDFMSEVLYQSHANKEIYTEIRFSEFSETALKAEIYGQKVDEFDEDIKAVTYHEAEVIKNEEGKHETMIIFDI